MNQVRGLVLIVLAGIAFYQGWAQHIVGQRAFLVYGVGVLALAMGVYRLTRKPPTRLR